MAPQLTFVVFIIGLECTFAIMMESSEIVGNLKDRILEKRKNDLKGVDAARLTFNHPPGVPLDSGTVKSNSWRTRRSDNWRPRS